MTRQWEKRHIVISGSKASDKKLFVVMRVVFEVNNTVCGQRTGHWLFWHEMVDNITTVSLWGKREAKRERERKEERDRLGIVKLLKCIPTIHIWHIYSFSTQIECLTNSDFLCPNLLIILSIPNDRKRLPITYSTYRNIP